MTTDDSNATLEAAFGEIYRSIQAEAPTEAELAATTMIPEGDYGIRINISIEGIDGPLPERLGLIISHMTEHAIAMFPFWEFDDCDHPDAFHSSFEVVLPVDYSDDEE